MVATRSARARKAAIETGSLATVRVEVDADEALVYKITCTTCTVRGAAGGTRATRAWSAYRPGADNGYLAAMDRWTFHLLQRHPDASAPCLAYLPAAQQRLQERREQG